MVPAGGSASDEATFETAYAAARCLNAHLEFFHIRIAPTEAALYQPHLAFARGRGMANAISRLQSQADNRHVEAERHVLDFCRMNGIELHDTPGRHRPVSYLVRQAAWHGIHASAQVIAANHETVAKALQRAAQSCRADLIVMGAYGQARWREICFGGCTQSMIDFCDRPVFLLR